jgi:hypothetical protein
MVNNSTNINKMNNHFSPQIFLAWDRHKDVAGLNQLIGSQNSPFYLF